MKMLAVYCRKGVWAAARLLSGAAGLRRITTFSRNARVLQRRRLVALAVATRRPPPAGIRREGPIMDHPCLQFGDDAARAVLAAAHEPVFEVIRGLVTSSRGRLHA